MPRLRIRHTTLLLRPKNEERELMEYPYLLSIIYVAFSLDAKRIRIILYRRVGNLKVMIEYIVLASAIINVVLLIGFFYEARNLKTVISMDKLAEILQNLIDDEFERVQTDKDLQQRIYIVGGLLGQGIKAALGVKESSGRFKMQDLIGALAGQFLQNIIPSIDKQPQQNPNTRTATSM